VVLAWLVHHWELKLLALAFSAALWVFVMSSEKTNVTLPLPVELDGIPSGLTVTSERPDTVDVQLHGLRSALLRVAPDALRVRINLAGSRPGEVVVGLAPDLIMVPPGVSVVRITPSVVRVGLAHER
jgi:YbbR domain-containing protein